MAWAQDATPSAAKFDAAACYQPFGDVPTLQYEKLADPPYNIALSNSYIGNVWRTQMIKMAKAYSELPEVNPFISTFCDATGLIIYFSVAGLILL